MTRTLLAACAAALLVAAPAGAAEPTEISIPYDEDVIVNYDAGTDTYDGADQVIDPDYGMTYATRAAVEDASGCESSPEGLPNDGVFPAGSGHPGVELDTDNANTGDNARYLEADGESFPVDVPDDVYAALDLFAISSHDASDLEAELTYTDGSSSTVVRDVPRWYENARDGYKLFDNMDWTNAAGSQCYEYNGVALFGVRYPVDTTKTLDSVVVTRTDPSVSTRRISVFGGLLLPERTLTVAKAGTGSGRVTSNGPDEIDCGSDCSEDYVHSARVTLLPDSDDGSTFTGWSGDCTGTGACTVSMTAARSVTATFDRPAEPQPPQQPQPQPPSPLPLPLPPAVGPTDRRVSFGTLASARRSCARRRMRLAVDDVPGETIVEAIFRIGTRSVRRRGAAIDDPFFFRRVPRRGFRLRVVMRTADGDTLRSSRRFKRCPRPVRRSRG